MMLTDLASVLRAAGLKVVEVDGWKTRGHGSMTNVHGVTCHHNAGGRTTNPKAGLNTIVEGREDLPGPLAHTYLDREGTWYVVAAGLCWHAGESRNTDYTNSHRIGVEAQAAGDGWSQDWPEAQMVSYAIGTKAMADHYGFSVSQVLGHKETCYPVGRKSDPSFNMTTFRTRVKAADTTPSEDFDMDAKEARALFRSELESWATSEKFIPNVAPGQTQATSNFTLAAALQLNDMKLDRGNDKDNAQLTAMQALADRQTALEIKLDALIKLLTPESPTK